MKARRFRSRSILLGAGVATASLALVVLPSLGYSAWHSSVSVAKTVSTATVPTPGSASVVAGSTTTSSSYPAMTFCPNESGAYYNGTAYINGVAQCQYTSYSGNVFYKNMIYSCPGSDLTFVQTCYTTTTTPDIKFTWATPTAYDASGQDFVTGVDVVEGSSCSASSWKVVATVSPSTDSYTVDNPSTSEYYGLQTKGLGGWTSTVSGCTLG